MIMRNHKAPYEKMTEEGKHNNQNKINRSSLRKQERTNNIELTYRLYKINILLGSVVHYYPNLIVITTSLSTCSVFPGVDPDIKI